MRKKNEITEYVAAALIFVCAVAVSLGIFLVCTQNSIERNSQKVIKTNVSRQSEHIKAILDIHYGYLRGIAKEIGKSEELVSDENMEMLISLEEETALERTALIEADGTAHYDNGAEKNVSSRRYFKQRYLNIPDREKWQPLIRFCRMEQWLMQGDMKFMPLSRGMIAGSAFIRLSLRKKGNIWMI